MNMASSRSHSLFTLTMTSRSPGSETFVTSKLNLVDLAGSERVAKSGAAGKQLTEAKHINLSLHYLESVICALQQGHRKRHVPYRNSLLTKLLRDSLGGNCVTAMIATLSTRESNKYESISTCRFAQRVAMVDNNAQRNEVLDDKSLIRQLRRRIAELQAELKVAQGQASAGGAMAIGGSPERASPARDGPVDRAQCQSIIRRFLRGKVTDPLAHAPSPAALRTCFELMHAVVMEERATIRELLAASPTPFTPCRRSSPIAAGQGAGRLECRAARHHEAEVWRCAGQAAKYGNHEPRPELLRFEARVGPRWRRAENAVAGPRVAGKSGHWEQRRCFSAAHCARGFCGRRAGSSARRGTGQAVAADYGANRSSAPKCAPRV